MKLEDFLAHVNSGKRIVDNSEELEYCSYLTQEAWKVTMELNNAYHRPEEVQDLMIQGLKGKWKSLQRLKKCMADTQIIH